MEAWRARDRAYRPRRRQHVRARRQAAYRQRSGAFIAHTRALRLAADARRKITTTTI
jgi:hypothetical protein